MNYYSLEADIFDNSAWYVGDILEVDNWRFVGPPMIAMDDPLRTERLFIQLKAEGIRTDFTFAGYAGVPVVSFKALKSISGLDGFTALPVLLSGGVQRDTYHLLQIWDVVDCFDESHSEFEVISETDPVFADRAGDYCSVTKLVVDASRAGDRHFFRVERLEDRVVVSEEVKSRFESARVTGAVFESVN
ncbi:MAG: hypothetical protein J4F49_09625 [Rhodobacteraceae bacterium]|nr:hypothetical protein [Paracoccaceae bacterium]